MPDKRDGTPQAQRGGRKKQIAPLKDITDPGVALGLHGKLGVGELLGPEGKKDLTPEEKRVFQKATHINWERFQELLAPRLMEAASNMAGRLASEEADKIPINFVALNLVQTLGALEKIKPQNMHPTSRSLTINIDACATPGDVVKELMGGGAGSGACSQRLDTGATTGKRAEDYEVAGAGMEDEDAEEAPGGMNAGA